jgi:hypothetical protein
LSACTTCWRSSSTQSSRSTRHSSSEHAGTAYVDHMASPCAVVQDFLPLLFPANCGMRSSVTASLSVWP